MSTFESSLTEVNGTPVLKLSGEARLDVATLERKSVQIAAMHPAKVVVDISEITFLSSLAMGTLVKMYRGVKANGGTLVLAGATPRILDVLRYARLDTLFAMSDTVEGALAAGK